MWKAEQLLSGRVEPYAEMEVAILSYEDFDMAPMCPHCLAIKSMMTLTEVEEGDTQESTIVADMAICTLCSGPTIIVMYPPLHIDEPVFVKWSIMKLLSETAKDHLEDDDDHARSAEANRTGSNVLTLPSPL